MPERETTGCAWKHAKLAGGLIALLLAITVTTVLAMTAGHSAELKGFDARMRLVEQVQAAQIERDKATLAAIERLQHTVDAIDARLRANLGPGTPPGP
jgi:hypothetical protein